MKGIGKKRVEAHGRTIEVSLRHYRTAKARRVEEVMEGAGIGVRPGGNVVSLNEHRRSKDGGSSLLAAVDR